MPTAKILLQLDPDPQISTFDSVVAVDSGVDQLFRHGAVSASQVRDLVYGLIFTRSPAELKNSAIFIGGSDVTKAESLLKAAVGSFFGPMRVSILFDPNGANTTAAAAVIAAGRHLELAGAETLVLAGTGPVGQRAARLLARQGARVRIASRKLDKATAVCDALQEDVGEGTFVPYAVSDDASLTTALDGAAVVIAAGAANVQLASQQTLSQASDLKVMIDLNAAPPVGIEGVDPMDKAKERDGRICYGAIGVGGTKMKIHKQALVRIFERNDLVLNAEEAYEIGLGLE
ncbi:NADP-dependent methylenetetrahydromethanopterin/methylenetetrahydrofolate dehydrogenase [Blastopirellula sp. JC732]|uniref:NADP-dependent methylenetetrahydromethanopterin/methylenetetrahydrofolate dehydrogenase n=1 Tax=Blastopirellula sediminis TaxID=2894196 RepID=A0A9X1MLZ7_9BACT|nr:NADP-dependent methylenetetrahydromethanopterin/methylenetetrahydrofolate dehydrogenase [Blastopirellula sediminis]MCC9607613.1 NADP-dependent methylenetetrahydromethanopterin/methylenetetrahydrofolate dehydrogenase [Blastopirellula sediminis]MCC9629094.1 NADP-dependent methylenetetrahydromethanopterin/methylenetetrahydrofolate dehydrogenase [Blastopirellula sediminis]